MPTLINETGLRFGVIPGRVPPAPLTATLIVKGAFALRPNAAAELLPDADQPPLDGDKSWDDDPGRGLRSAGDFAPFKTGTDLLLAGHCHAPGGKPVPYTQVSFGVGNFRKPAIVIGDRRLRSSLTGPRVDSPIPFTTMPLDWSRTWGGPDVPENPVGRGRHDLTLPDGSRARFAANIETTEQATSASGSFGRRAGFGPIDPNWAERMKKVGTYDAAWLATRWPWLPDDFDWSYFNAAPPDQCLDRIYLKGDEPLEFINLHPEHAVLTSRLPGLFARCFIRVRKGNDLEFREVPLRIDTLFADMDASHVILTWRGVTPAASLKLKEIEDYFVLLEPLNAPMGRSLADYEALYERRLKEIQSEFEFEPVVLDPMVLPTLTPPSTAWAERLQKMADEMQAAAKVSAPAPSPALGLMGVALAPAVLPLPPGVRKIADATALAAADFAILEAHAPGFMAKYPPPDFSEFEEDDAKLAAFTGLPKDEDEPVEEKEWTRESVIEQLAAGGRLDRQELAGLDLSRLDLSRAGLVGAVLEGTDLTGSTLTGADLTRAAMAGAILDEAVCDGAVLTGADMAEVSARNASFVEATLVEADLADGRLPGARFTRARAARSSFSGCDLTGAQFDEADCDLADFAGAILVSADFSGAMLASADMDGVDASEARFEKAMARNLRASKSNLRGASFRECRLDESVIEESDLTGTDFRGVQLRLATLTGSRFDGAVFGMADLRSARLDDIRAHEATFVGVNLFRGTLERADLAGASFLDCNLYEVEIWDAILDRAQLRDCNLKGTKLAR